MLLLPTVRAEQAINLARIIGNVQELQVAALKRYYADIKRNLLDLSTGCTYLIPIKIIL